MRGKKILIAENDEDMLLLLGQSLSKHGYEVQAINNSLDIFNKSFICPDLFILDYQMEFSDGIAVSKYLRLRSESSNTPILMISNDPKKRNTAIKVGVNHFLHKPFYFESLLRIIEELIIDNAARGRGRMTILYIDDDEDDLEIFRAAIAEVDPTCQYFQASDGKKGLCMLQSVSPDYIFLDVNMPCMDGIEVLKTIRADEHLRDIPVIMFSTSIGTEDELLYREKGATECILKPNGFGQLCKILRSLLSTSGYKMTANE